MLGDSAGDIPSGESWDSFGYAGGDRLADHIAGVRSIFVLKRVAQCGGPGASQRAPPKRLLTLGGEVGDKFRNRLIFSIHHPNIPARPNAPT